MEQSYTYIQLKLAKMLVENLTMKRASIALIIILIPFVLYNFYFRDDDTIANLQNQKSVEIKLDMSEIKSSQSTLQKIMDKVHKQFSKFHVEFAQSQDNCARKIDSQKEELTNTFQGVVSNIEKTILSQKNNDKENEHILDKDFSEDELIEYSINKDSVEKKEIAGAVNTKWIVVTSIFPPTKDIKSLAAIDGWKLVVVGDTKTPQDWRLKGVVYLSTQEQLKLGYDVFGLLKYNAYTRKNIGYLYAIQHGAKYIYDTDDDNVPTSGQIEFDDLTSDKTYLVYHSNRTFYNVFEHFGQSTMWPRGYPLNQLAKLPVRSYRKCSQIRPVVQQGVVDGDPDLDAIQRLTRKDENVKFDVRFDPKQEPVVLPHHSFTPYNSQNTFHVYDAFWGLLLPQTTAFRVTDIWRSYITQRLIWDIGGHLAYYGPNAYQDRSAHDYLRDYLDEDALYTQCLKLTNFLIQWHGSSDDVLERYFELIKDLYKEKILKARDVRLARAWVRDLISFGYKPPLLTEVKMKCSEEVFTILPNEQPSIFLRSGAKYVNVNSVEKTDL